MTAKTVIDVLLVANSSSEKLQGWTIPDGDRIQLDEGIWIDRAGRIDKYLPVNSTQIMNACEPAGYVDPGTCEHGHNYRPTRQHYAWYVLWNERPTDPGNVKWDMDHRLMEFVMLSRLVHPTPIGYKYAARIQQHDGQTRVIPFDGFLTYVAHGPYHLTPAQWQETAKLVNEYRQSNAVACRRLNSALWYREKLARELHLEVRWSLLITAIESLTTEWTTRRGSGDRFKKGITKLARETGVSISQQDRNDAWNRRASLVHGQGWPGGMVPNNAQSDSLYPRFESLLDRSLRKLIEDVSFRSHFMNDQTLEAWLK